MYRSFVRRLLFVLPCVLFGGRAEAATVTLAWDPGTDTSITNYSVFVGTRSGSYTTAVAVGLRTTYTFTGLADDTVYFFAVQAQNAVAGSALAEISFRTPPRIAAGSDLTRSDFNRDGSYDLLWYNQTSGQAAAWLMNGTSLLESRWLNPDRVADTTWRLKGSADFNGDGKPDILWQNENTGQLAIWYLDGTYMFGSALITPDRPGDPNWKVVAIRDLNWDGYADLIFRHKTTGQIAVWFLQGTTAYAFQMLSIPQVADLNWQIAGSADINKDGNQDLVWQNVATGDLAVWYLQGPTVIGTGYLSPARIADPNWRIVSIADVDRNGTIDLVWRHQITGTLAVWYMNGATLTGSAILSPSSVTDMAWTIVGAR